MQLSKIITTISRVLRRVLLGLIAFITVLIAIPFFLKSIGYYVNDAGWYVGKIAAAQDNPDFCSRLIVYLEILGPSQASRRNECLFTYAEMKEDATICERLLPSEYGLACLSEVGGLLTVGFGCSHFNNGDINCSSGVRGKYNGIENCNIYKQKDLQDWCYQERTRILESAYECEKISPEPPELREECQRWYAFKLKDTNLCESITDKNRQSLCKTKINAWLKYPELRNSFYFGNNALTSSISSATSP